MGKYIRKVVSDRDNDCIWISHNNSSETPPPIPLGLTQFNGKTWKTPITYDVVYSDNYRSNDFGTALFVHNGVVWTNYGTTLIRYDGKSLSFYGGFTDSEGRGGLIWDIVHDIRPGYNDYYWICQHLSEPAMQTAAITGLRSSPKSDVRYIIANRSSSKTCLAWDNIERLWAGSSGGLLYIGRPKGDESDDFTTFESLYIYGRYITCMAFDKNNKLWMGVTDPNNNYNGEGLFCYSYEENPYFIKRESVYSILNSELTSNTILAITFDNNDIMWLGTDRGAARFDGASWTIFNIDNSPLPDNNVNAIAVDDDNTIWFGTNNGLAKYTGEVITTSVDEYDDMPEALPVLHSYPNPFNPSTTIEFTLPESGFTMLSIYNISGQKVRELAAGYMTAGAHSLTWDGRDGSGDAVSSGIYITRLVASKQVAAGRMVFLK